VILYSVIAQSWYFIKKERTENGLYVYQFQEEQLASSEVQLN
jgi:hypothetical protein